MMLGIKRSLSKFDVFQWYISVPRKWAATIHPQKLLEENGGQMEANLGPMENSIGQNGINYFQCRISQFDTIFMGNFLNAKRLY